MIYRLNQSPYGEMGANPHSHHIQKGTLMGDKKRDTASVRKISAEP